MASARPIPDPAPMSAAHFTHAHRRRGNTGLPGYDAQLVKLPRRTVWSLALSTALIGLAAAFATPAQADSVADEFLAALTDAGLSSPDPASAVALGQSVCPMLAEPGQTTANAAATVADAAGMPLGPATMFTGIAITMFCPSVVSSLANGQVPFGLQIPGL